MRVSIFLILACLLAFSSCRKGELEVLVRRGQDKAETPPKKGDEIPEPKTDLDENNLAEKREADPPTASELQNFQLYRAQNQERVSYDFQEMLEHDPDKKFVVFLRFDPGEKRAFLVLNQYDRAGLLYEVKGRFELTESNEGTKVRLASLSEIDRREDYLQPWESRNQVYKRKTVRLVDILKRLDPDIREILSDDFQKALPTFALINQDSFQEGALVARGPSGQEYFFIQDQSESFLVDWPEPRIGFYATELFLRASGNPWNRDIRVYFPVSNRLNRLQNDNTYYIPPLALFNIRKGAPILRVSFEDLREFVVDYLDSRSRTFRDVVPLPEIVSLKVEIPGRKPIVVPEFNATTPTFEMDLSGVSDMDLGQLRVTYFNKEGQVVHREQPKWLLEEG